MREIGRPFYRAIYEATVDTRLLADGLLPFRVRSSSGEVRIREFVVANQRDPSPVNVDATLTFSVGSDTGWTTHKVPSKKVGVLLNGHLVGTLAADARRKYSLHIPAKSLRKANVLTFRFSEPDDGISLNDPILKFQNTVIRDPRDAALRRVRTAHWGKDAVDWGGFIVGNAAPPDETPFHRKQNEFCFVLGR